MFEESRIRLYRSPIVVAKKNKQQKAYYTLEEFNNDLKQLESEGWEISYKKGLGSLSKNQYDEMINNPRYDTVTLDNEYQKMLEVAFGNNADSRKEWLQE